MTLSRVYEPSTITNKGFVQQEAFGGVPVGRFLAAKSSMLFLDFPVIKPSSQWGAPIYGTPPAQATRVPGHSATAAAAAGAVRSGKKGVRCHLDLIKHVAPGMGRQCKRSHISDSCCIVRQ